MYALKHSGLIVWHLDDKITHNTVFTETMEIHFLKPFMGQGILHLQINPSNYAGKAGGHNKNGGFSAQGGIFLRKRYETAKGIWRPLFGSLAN